MGRFWRVGLVLLALFILIFAASLDVDSTDDFAIDPIEQNTAEFEALGTGDLWIERVNRSIFKFVLFDIAFGSIVVDGRVVELPFVVAYLGLASLYFTVRFRFTSFRLLGHAYRVVRGRFSSSEARGELTHFEALTNALSGTIGLGNIAGVAIAISLGGPGAVFWIIVMALLSMAAKFASCTLSQMYRKVHPDGSVSGGPMYYLDYGLAAKGPAWACLGKLLGVSYALMTLGVAIGTGNLFQVNQTLEALEVTFGSDHLHEPFVATLMLLVAVIVMGGVRQISTVTSRLLPLLCLFYTASCLLVIGLHIKALGPSLWLILRMAFTDNALFGGLVGVLVRGLKRSAFTNEAGLGSASIVHAAAKTDEPVREGVVAMLGPVIDTALLCLLTALVLLTTGVWNNSDYVQVHNGILPGVGLVLMAFKQVHPLFPYVLLICIALFAFNSMLAWCYNGERAWIYLLDHAGESAGRKSVLVFRLTFVAFIGIAAEHHLKNILLFSDLMILSMALPNLLGSWLLSREVWKVTQSYLLRYRAL